MKYKGFIICAVLTVIVQTGFAQERNFYFDIGIGSGFINYGGELDAAISDVEAAGLERTLVFADVSLGKALTDNLFVGISSTAFGDSFAKESNVFADVYLYTLLYGVGVKYYPLPSALHLQLGADVGLACMLLTSTVSDFEMSRSPLGFGGKISVSYDFDSDLTGPALLLGTQLLADFLENELVVGFAIFAKFVLKTG